MPNTFLLEEMDEENGGGTKQLTQVQVTAAVKTEVLIMS